MIVIVGAGGQLGSAFSRVLPNAVRVTRDVLDLDDGDIAGVIQGLRPSVVINCAAYTDVDRAEAEPDRAHRLNATVVGALAAASRRAGAGFVTFSTDYVFDGTSPEPYVESSQPNPVSVYGASKLEGERLALAAHPECLVVRTSWLLSGTHPNFAATMLRLIGAGPVRVVGDQTGRPTLVDDLAPAVLDAVAAEATGLLHLANQGTLSWYQLACEVASIAGLDTSRVEMCTTSEYPTPAARPANSVLDSERAGGLGLTPMPHYRQGLERIVSQLAAA